MTKYHDHPTSAVSWSSFEVRRFSKPSAWLRKIHGFPMDFPWISHGFPMDFRCFHPSDPSLKESFSSSVDVDGSTADTNEPSTIDMYNWLKHPSQIINELFNSSVRALSRKEINKYILCCKSCGCHVFAESRAACTKQPRQQYLMSTHKQPSKIHHASDSQIPTLLSFSWPIQHTLQKHINVVWDNLGSPILTRKSICLKKVFPNPMDHHHFPIDNCTFEVYPISKYTNIWYCVNWFYTSLNPLYQASWSIKFHHMLNVICTCVCVCIYIYMYVQVASISHQNPISSLCLISVRSCLFMSLHIPLVPLVVHPMQSIYPHLMLYNYSPIQSHEVPSNQS